ncbi:PREDICTED: uncharacterized protein LOC104779711 [Camelina sativa]|uniref:Uncharacterized protein LOC104779711 n=1 Tax=Camelina sativa TaxID=90675 RepID=A0ABM0YKI7_CAMSA|nr:PREDICTED: uncharacterized protein LOC104779711 [Camelina sativa]
MVIAHYGFSNYVLVFGIVTTSCKEVFPHCNLKSASSMESAISMDQQLPSLCILKFALSMGWCCISSEGSPPVLGATNFRRSLSSLHAEVEAFIWAMRCMIRHDFRDVAFLTDCSDLVKMVSSPIDWPAFATYLDDIRIDKEEFSSFSLIYVSRNANVRADSLARQARVSPHHVLFVDNFPPNWLV